MLKLGVTSNFDIGFLLDGSVSYELSFKYEQEDTITFTRLIRDL